MWRLVLLLFPRGWRARRAQSLRAASPTQQQQQHRAHRTRAGQHRLHRGRGHVCAAHDCDRWAARPLLSLCAPRLTAWGLCRVRATRKRVRSLSKVVACLLRDLELNLAARRLFERAGVLHKKPRPTCEEGARARSSIAPPPGSRHATRRAGLSSLCAFTPPHRPDTTSRRWGDACPLARA